ncbi:MAG: NAD(P)/FAD-dependent oxidoreductase [Pseudanabaenaceae cyanobacterium]
MKPRVVVVGGGFAGWQVIQSLRGQGFDLVLLDRQPHQVFIPLLYQVAVGLIPARTVARPLAQLCNPDIPFAQDPVTAIDLAQQQVHTAAQSFPYDFLVLAAGSVVRSQPAGTYGLQTLEQALALRDRLAQTPHGGTWVVVGGGATGVEMAGALAEWSRWHRQSLRIVLVQSRDRLLPDLPTHLATHARRWLQRLGVELHLSTTVEVLTAHTVNLQGEILPCTGVIWTAGLVATPLTYNPPVETVLKQRLAVRPTLQLPDWDNVYAVGDLAAAKVRDRSEYLTGVAPEALQQGVHVARNLQRQRRGLAPQPFTYWDKGRLAVIGGYGAVGKIGPISLTGFGAWFLWFAVHSWYLPGWRNRATVLSQWLRVYLLRRKP